MAATKGVRNFVLKIAFIVYPLRVKKYQVAAYGTPKIIFLLSNRWFMKKKYTHALHLFRRDLRLDDNTSLHAAAAAGAVSVGFIFDPKQVDENKYKSIAALTFMAQSLEELAKEIHARGGVFNFWYDDPAAQLEVVLKHHPDIDLVTINADYTPFSSARDAALAAVCKKHEVDFVAHHDALLNCPGSVLTGGGTMFKIFTPFYNVARVLPVAQPEKLKEISFAEKLLHGAHKTIPVAVATQCQENEEAAAVGGPTAALAILAQSAAHNRYTAVRDFPALAAGTTLLSAHNKFGTVSIREVYHALHKALDNKAEPLLRSLYWRDFFCHVAVSQPRVFGHAYNQEYDDLVWDNDKKLFEAWCSGKTGFPLVDAGMRQLNETGFMHNRVRMVVASLLIKDMHIDWQWGERYFAQKLVDYDPAVNNGNWQWVASTGCDSQPYFRIFNPWLQQKKFDPEAEYIKRWVPELRNATAAQIHAAEKKPIAGYVRPVVDHAMESKKTLARYRGVK